MRSTRVKTRQVLGIEEQLSLLDVALQNATGRWLALKLVTMTSSVTDLT